jgi:hypothetical protein
MNLQPEIKNMKIMKTRSASLGAVLIRLFALPLALLLGQALPAAVTFTVTPSAVSNTYPGTISLAITGLTNTETVVVRKFLDLNTNGVIDGNDWLVQQFALRDGTNFVIGGVTNFNVPGDLNAATGAITATLNFQGGDFVQNIAGNYLYKLSSSGGHFEPLTNGFSVTNFPYPQKFTGNVAGAGATVSNAVILLFAGQAGNSSPQAGVVADNSGGYTFPVPAGTYSLVALRSNYVANMSTAPTLTLAASQTIATNLNLISATASISGDVVDANDSSIGLPGILLPVQTDSGLLAVAFTDLHGHFNVPVTAGTWEIKADSATLMVHGYVRWQDETNVAAGATGVTLAYPKGTALIYGSVTDNLGNPLAGIDVEAYDNNDVYGTDGYTDANGNYVIAVLGGLGSGDPWLVQVSNDSSPTNYIFPQPFYDGGTNLSAGQAVRANFTAILAPNHIAGNVKAGGTNLAGVGVWAEATINSVHYQVNDVYTDSDGNYSMNVANGTWTVGLNGNGGENSLDDLLGGGNYQSPANQTVVIANNNGTANFTVELYGGITFITTSLPAGEVNVYYDQFLQVSSCNGSVTGTIVSGSLPPGLTGDGETGEFYGTPTTAGTYTFTVQVTDGVSTTNKEYSIGISNAVQITTTSLPDGTNGAAYSRTLQAGDGLTPYTWSLAPGSASLPANLTLATNGVLSGTPATNGTFYFYVRVTDAASATADQLLSLTIVKISLQITTTTLPNATQNAAYSATLAATGGQPPYYWSRAPGSAKLPYYLDLDTNGVISGTPVNSGTNRFIVRVTDAASATANQLLTLVVNASTNQQVIVLNQATQLANGQFQFTFNTASGVSYIIQYSTNLTDWTSVSILSGFGGPLTVSDLTATDKQRFYRVKAGP